MSLFVHHADIIIDRHTPSNKGILIVVQFNTTITFPSHLIQFKGLFRVDINHTYNTSSNELLIIDYGI
jgi:hypothetical protein